MKINMRKSLILIGILLLTLIITIPTKSLAFEKSIKNATGFGAVTLNFRQKATSSSKRIGTIPAGTPFRIISESGNYWKVSCNDKIGYVYHPYCMINLPDVEPSIMYEITNANESIYVSSGENLPRVTGTALYSTGKVQNNRLDKEEYIVPVLYSTAKKISKAQAYAAAEGYTLKIYDAYRPSSVSKTIRDSLNELYNSNATVRYNINYSYGASGRRYTWGKAWFLAQGVSAHNTGAAIDVTLANKETGKEYVMPSEMHELSVEAIKYYSPNVSKTASNYSKTMNKYAKLLDKYCTKAGLSTLASEWWHFQETAGHNRIKNYLNGKGCNFQVKTIVSTK